MQAPVGSRTWVAWSVAAAAVLWACWPLFGNAVLTLDDYRYLRELRDIRSDVPGAWLRAMIVENRWDDWWWIAEGTFVRFFRPLVAPLYALDEAVHGLDPRGYVATNVVLHLLATALAQACFAHLLPARAAIVATLAFAVRGCHFENLYYVAGRTDTLAAIACLATFWVHLCTRAHTGKRAQIVVATFWFVALLCREYAVALPLLFVLCDRWHPPDGRSVKIMAACRRQGTFLVATIAYGLAYLALRHLALGEVGSGTRPTPYFWWPGQEGFAARTLAVWLQYGIGLTSGAYVEPFLASLEGLRARIGLGELLTSGLLFHALIAVGLLVRATRFATVWLLLLLVPLLPIYSAARYLYLPAIGFCLLLAVLAEHALRRPTRVARAGAWTLLLLALVLPAVRLRAIHAWLPKHMFNPTTPQEAYPAMLAGSGVKMHPDRPLYLVDFVGGWYEMQFLADMLIVELDRPLPPIRFLTVRTPRDTTSTRVRRLDDHRIELTCDGQVLPVFTGFAPRPMAVGDRFSRAGHDVKVTAIDGVLATRIEVQFDVPLARVDLARCVREAGGWAIHRIDV